MSMPKVRPGSDQLLREQLPVLRQRLRDAQARMREANEVLSHAQSEAAAKQRAFDGLAQQLTDIEEDLKP